MSMVEHYLEVTYRRGRPLAAYVSLPRKAGDKSVRTEQPFPGIVVDYAADGRPIGIEITSPKAVKLNNLNRVLDGMKQGKLSESDWAPLTLAAG
jgi:hypothetical protein